MSTYYHGTENLKLHEGICLTTSIDSAQQYAGPHGIVYEIELSDDLTTERVDGYDHDTNNAPADFVDFRRECAARGIDIVIYDDEDIDGTRHDCIRIVSDRALASTIVVGPAE